MNVHPSLLPKYRGPAPIYHALLNEEKETGISIIELSRGRFDEGKILYQVIHSISEFITYEPLLEQLAELGANALLYTLVHYSKLRASSREQDPFEGLSVAHKVRKEMGFIRWKTHGIRDIWRLWRALGDTVGVHTKYNYNQLRVRLRQILPPVLLASPTISPTELTYAEYLPGMLRYDVGQKLLFIKCIDGWIACSALQVDARRTIPASVFANGYRMRNIRAPSELHRFVDIEDIDMKERPTRR